MRRKGQILIQNDCWIGHGAIIMGGVTIHNGAVVAAQSVVTKDVPPYAVVAGNPARIVKWRFSEEEIAALLKISWWDWNAEQMQKAKKSMQGNLTDFIETHIKEASMQLEAYNIRRNPVQRLNRDGLVYAFAADLDEPYPVCAHVIDEFCKKFCNQDAQLVLYLGGCKDVEKSYERVLELLEPYSDVDCCIQIIDEEEVTLRDVIRNVDGYITNRSRENIYATCMADLYGKFVISGVDRPIF